MNIMQFLEFQAISVAGGVIYKTIAMLHHVTTRVQHKDKYYWNHGVSAVSSNRHIKTLVFPSQRKKSFPLFFAHKRV